MAALARTTSASLRALSAQLRSPTSIRRPMTVQPPTEPAPSPGLPGSTFTKDHEWISHDAAVSDIATIGITTYAAKSLGDVVFVELPELGTGVAAGDAFGAVESVKSASDIMSPVSGTVVEANEALRKKPALINHSPEADGWIAKVKVSDGAEMDGLLGREEYEAFVKGVGEEH